MAYSNDDSSESLLTVPSSGSGLESTPQEVVTPEPIQEMTPEEDRRASELLDAPSRRVAVEPQPIPEPLISQPNVSFKPQDVDLSLKAYKGETLESLAEAENHSKAYGIPLDLALRQRDVFNQMQESSRIALDLEERDEVGQLKYPRLADWSQSPLNMIKVKDDIDKFKEIEATLNNLKELDKPMYKAGRASTYASMFASGATMALTALPKSVTAVTHWLDLFGVEKGTTLEENPFYQLMNELQEAPEKLLPQNPKYTGELTGQVLQGFGQLAGTILGGGVTGIAKTSPKMFGYFMGVAQGQSSIYDDGKRHGASDEDAYKASVLGGVPAGLMEGIVPGKMMKRLFAGIGGKKTQILIEAGLEGGAETLTETLQSVIETKVAKEIYDKDRKYFDDMVRSGTVGGIVGTIASFIVSAATGVKVRSHNTLIQRQQEAQTKVLKEIQTAFADKDKVEGQIEAIDKLQKAVSGTGLAKTQPDQMQEFIDSNHVDPVQGRIAVTDLNKIEGVFFQDAVTEEDKAAAQAALDQFKAESGVTNEAWEDAKTNNLPIEIKIAPLVVKYGQTPVFKVVNQDLQEQRQDADDRIKASHELISKELERVKVENTPPPQLVAMRNALVKPKEAGGLGWTGVQADQAMSIAHRIFQHTGALNDKFFDNFRFVVGDKAVEALLEGKQKPEGIEDSDEVSTLYPLMTPENFAKAADIIVNLPPEGDPRRAEGLETAKNEIETIGEPLTEEQIIQYEREIGAEREKEAKADLKQRNKDFMGAIRLSGKPPSVSLMQKQKNPLAGDWKQTLQNKRLPGLTSNTAPTMDIFRQNLSSRGYHFETEMDLIKGFEQWLVTGIPPDVLNQPDDVDTLMQERVEGEIKPEGEGKPIANVPKQTMEGLRKLQAQSRFEKYKATGKISKDTGTGDLFGGEEGTLFQVDGGDVQSYIESNDIPKDNTLKEEVAKVEEASSEPYSQGELFGGVSQVPAGTPSLTPNVLTSAAITAEDFKKAEGRVSAFVDKFLTREIPEFNIAGKTVSNPQDLAALLMPLRTPYFETLKVVFLGEDDTVLHSQVLHVGTVGQSVAAARDILQSLNSSKARGKSKRVIIAHNHPSGNPNPSPDDIKTTNTIRSVLQRAGLDLVDHVITNGKKFYSFRQKGSGDIENPKLADWEKVAVEDLYKIDNAESLSAIINNLRQANPDSRHVIYLNSKLQTVAIDRVDKKIFDKRDDLIKHIINAAASFGAMHIMLDGGGAVYQPNYYAEISRELSDSELKLVDVSTVDIPSYKTSLLISEDLTPTGEGGSLGYGQAVKRTDPRLGETVLASSTGNQGRSKGVARIQESPISRDFDYETSAKEVERLSNHLRSLRSSDPAYEEALFDHVNFLVNYALQNEIKVSINKDGKIIDVWGLENNVFDSIGKALTTQPAKPGLSKVVYGGEAAVYFDEATGKVYKVYAKNHLGGYGFKLDPVNSTPGKPKLHVESGSVDDIVKRFGYMDDVGANVDVWIGGIDPQGRLHTQSDLLEQLDSATAEAKMKEWLKDRGAISLNLVPQLGKMLSASKEVKENQYLLRGISGQWYLATDVKPDNFLQDPEGNAIANDLILRPLSTSEKRLLTQETGETLFQEDKPSAPVPPFFSQLSKTIEALPQEKMTIGQLRAALSPEKGVKADELKWTGFDELLARPDTDKITKAEALKFAQENAVQVEEVVKGVDQSRSATFTEKRSREMFDQDWDSENGHLFYKNNGFSKDEAWEELKDSYIMKVGGSSPYQDRPETQTKYSTLQLPGGENYRELLFTLPARKSTDNPALIELRKFQEKHSSEIEKDTLSPELNKKFLELSKEASSTGMATDISNFKSTHFDEPNILAHVRFNERTDANGKKVLFIEEVQSDLHQKGRKQGYAGQNPLTDVEKKRVEQLQEDFKNLKFAPSDPEYAEMIGYGERMKGGVPNAPFKKTWHELVMKRMLRYAAENGFDKVAWTTGEQQAQRYPNEMRKVADKIEWSPWDNELDPEGKSRTVKISKENKSVAQVVVNSSGEVIDAPSSSSSYVGKNLTELVGKAMAASILEKPSGTIEGKDFTMGAKGFQDIYDEKLVQFVNKYGKKWGAKVGETNISYSENAGKYVGPVRTTEEINNAIEVADKGGPDIFVNPFNGEKTSYAVNRVSVASGLRRLQNNLRNGMAFNEAVSQESQDIAELLGGKFEYPKAAHGVHSVDITPAMKESVLTQGQALFQEKKGFYRFDPVTGQHVVGLFESSDVSTLLHEMFHFWQQHVSNLIETGQAGQQVIKDYNTILRWAGVKEGQKPTREQFEKMARAFEQYFMKGKAPTADLQSTFDRLRQWLLDIYQDLSALGVNISDDVSEAFDRILATQAEIEESRRFYGQEKDSIIDLMSKDEEKKKAVRDIKTKNKLTDEDKAIAQRMKAYEKSKEGKKQLEMEVNAAIEADPFYAALNEAEKDKINFIFFKQAYGSERADALKAKFPEIFDDNGKGAIEYFMTDFGFESSDQFIEAMEVKPSRGEAINLKTKELLLQKEAEIRADVQSKGQVTDGDEDTHTENSLATMIAETQLLADELAKINRGKKLADSRKPERLLGKAFKDAARAMLGRKTVKEAVRYDLMAKAEAKAAREQIKALQKGDKEAALEHGRRRLFYHASVLESIKLRNELEKIVDRYSFKNIKATMEKVEDSYREPIQGLLYRYGLSPNPSQRPFNLGDLSLLSEELAADAPAFIKQGKPVESYRDLTADEMMELDDYLEEIATYGRNSLMSLEAEKQRTFQSVRDESIGNMTKLKPKDIPNEKSPFYWLSDKWQRLKDTNMFPVFIADTVDYYASKVGRMGIFKTLYRKMIEANQGQITLQDKTMRKVARHLGVLSGAVDRMRKDKGNFFSIENAPWPEKSKQFGEGNWNGERVIAFLLNLGNEHNKKHVVEGMNLDQAGVDSITSLLTSKEMEAIQGVWDEINELYPEMDKVHFDLYNRHSKKVEGDPVTVKTKDGEVTLKGGYYPMAYDTRYDSRAEAIKEEALQRKNAVYRSAKAEEGMTKARSGGLPLPPRLSLSVLYEHIGDVTRFITHSRSLRDFNILLNDPLWKAEFISKMGDNTWKGMIDWLKYQANPEAANGSSLVGKNAVLDSGLEWMRKMSTYLMLGFKFSSAAVQKLGLIPAGQKIGYRWLAEGIRQMGVKGQGTFLLGLNSQAWEDAVKESEGLRIRAGNIDRNVTEVMNSLKAFPKFKLKLGEETYTVKDLRDLAFKMMQMSDRGVILPVYLGAKSKYLSEMYDSEKTKAQNYKDAIAYAEGIVQETQPTGLTADTNWLQRDPNKLRKLFTMVMSWNFKFGAMLQNEHRAYKEGAISRTQYYSFLAQNIVLAGILEELLRSAIKLEEPEWLDSLINMISAPISWIPFVRDLPYAVLKKGKVSGVLDRVPAYEAGKRVLKGIDSPISAMQDKKAWSDALIDMAKAGEAVAGFPISNTIKDVNTLVENLEEE